MPRPLGNNARAAKIDASPAGTEKSLPLGEGGFAKQRRMRGGRGYQCSTGQILPLEGGAPHSESKIYMTASGSHTSTMVVRPKPDRMRGGRHLWFAPSLASLLEAYASPVLRMKLGASGRAAAPTALRWELVRNSPYCLFSASQAR